MKNGVDTLENILGNDVFRKYESITPENRKEIIRDLKQALSPELLTKMVQEV